MSSPARRILLCVCSLPLLLLFVLPASAQSTGGRVIGKVSDSTGAVVSGVNVKLINAGTGVAREATTNDTGDYSFVEVTPGNYRVEYTLQGFKKNVRDNVTLDVNQVLTLNATLQPGGTQEVVEVTSEAPQVDTTSTQLGAVINDRSVNELPLNARDTYQFLQLQPGVQSQLGSSGTLFYGSDSAGSVSVNGGRGRSNNFSVNGGDANDQFVNLPTVQPTPDSIQEFRVITNTFDAEYGRNSGAVVNVITKSGTNALHGNIYEYFRNTVLNAQGYFNTVKPQFNQNQFGGTLGGPIKKDRTFFFVSYEGRRIRNGQSEQQVTVPTLAERTGDFSAIAANGQQFTGTLSDPFVASVLNGRSGCANAIAAAGGAAPAAGAAWNTIFPTGVIPTACQDPVAADLLQKYIPNANVGTNIFQTVPVGSDFQDQFTIRIDHRISNKQNFTGYYYYTNDSLFQPLSFFQQAGANLPGFGANTGSRYQQYNLTHTYTLTNTVVNEARFTYMREGQLQFQAPQTTNLVTASCSSAVQQLCFTGTSDSSAINTLPGAGPSFGITPGLGSHFEGVPFITISGGAVIGNNFEGQLPQVGNTFQWSDNLTWVRGNHTYKFGIDVRRSRFDQTLYFNVSGAPTFSSSDSNSTVAADGSSYADFLLGLASSYTQGAAQRENIRSTSVYPFAEDSWKIKQNLTLNYGLRWELDTPLTDVLHHVQTFRPGQNSTVYPCTLNVQEQSQFGAPDCATAGFTPTGLVFPGDKGVPAGLTQTYYKAFAPRIGLAYSPNFDKGFLNTIFGNNGKTSIRTGWGMFYNPMEQLVMEQFGAEPPFGGSTFLSNTFFNTPFVGQNGVPNPNPYNGILQPVPGQAQDWQRFRPIELFGEFQPHMRTQYSVQYNFTIQREMAKDLMLQLGYVGSQGHRLLASHDINPSTPQTCLDIMSIAAANPANVLSGPLSSSPSQINCAPLSEDTEFFIPSTAVAPAGGFHVPYGPNGPTVIPAGASIGSVAPNGLTLVGLRPFSSPNCNPFSGAGCPVDGIPVFTDIFAEDTIANSNYNALEAMLEKRFSHGLQFQAAYTFSKSIDQASSFEETLNPFNFGASKALSLFNSAQRFVISYFWDLPIPKHDGFAGKVLDGWAVSGITEFQSGFPIRLTNDALTSASDTELINSFFFEGTEAPNLVAPFHTLNPKANPTGLGTGYWFNPADFANPPTGQFNNGTQRTICCGPGLNNTDFAVHKMIPLTETKYFQFRAEIFNIANHTQFVNPDGNIGDGLLFGKITSARDPRLVQFALKFFF